MIGDHPVVRNLEQTGYPDRRADKYPTCPICGAEETMFYVQKGEIIGCWSCVQTKEAWEVGNG